MRIARRSLMLALGLVAAAAGAGIVLDKGLAATLRDILREGFGDRLADSDAAGEFIAEIVPTLDGWDSGAKPAGQRVLWRLSAGLREATGYAELAVFVQEAFIEATTAVRAWETGDEPIFLGLGDAHAQPCQNPLGARFL